MESYLENYTVRYNMSARKDTVRVKNLTCPYIDREGKAFVLLKDRTGRARGATPVHPSA